MYKVVIADDDKHIRERLINGIDWESLHLTVCGESSDGEETICLYEQYAPHIIIMDINMPNKDGLEVTQEIFSRDKEVIIICITGFNDFEYAQTAIKLGVFDMFLKPLDMSEMTSILSKAVAHLEEIRQGRQDTEKLQKLALESLPVLQKTFLQSLFDGVCKTDETETMERLLDLHMDIKGNHYCVAILSPQLPVLPKSENDLKLIALSHTSQELIAAAGLKCFSLFDNLCNTVFLLSWDEDDISVKIDDIFSNIRNKLLFYLNLNIYASIGSIVQSIKNISSSMTDARDAYDYRHLFAQNNIVNIKNVIRVFNRTSVNFNLDKTYIVGCFKDGDIDKLSHRLNELVSNVMSSSSINTEGLQRIFIELTVLVLHTASDIGIDTGLYLEGSDPYRKIMQMTNIRDLMNWFIHLSGNLILAINENKGNKTSKLITISKQYIKEHLSDLDLGLVTVSEHAGLSSVYFCQLFHTETGIKLNEYINSKRIERAKELLKDPVRKIYEISILVGYNNPNYFNYVFKKHTGLSPNEFRQNL